ncbi:proprotein convertase P-domain-containing protein [Nonomuraea jabiensis]|uniref:proprotein convertase P-domain-containing protein n=1 Tax=Nonomuraea jabiensis TaxID=882448 RepID=UPI00341B19B1
MDSPIGVSGILGKGPAQLHVWVSVQHPWVGDLKLQLVSPDGKVFPLREPSPDGSDSIDETYDVVEDITAGDTGHLDGWWIEF